MPRSGRMVFCLLLAACAGRQGPELGILHRSHNFPLVLDAGMAVAPFGHADAVEDAGAVAAFLSNQMTTALMAGWEGTFVPPDQVLATIKSGGEPGLESFRSFRLGRMKGEALVAADCAALSRVVLHRFLLLLWVREALESGLDETATDYTSAGFAKDVARLHFDHVRGELTGVLVDLWEAELLWEGKSEYLTQNAYADAEHATEELAAARDAGVLDLVNLLNAP